MPKYKCHLCDYEEEIAGKENDGPIKAHSNVLGITVTFKNSLIKNMCAVERKHVMSKHWKKRE